MIPEVHIEKKIDAGEIVQGVQDIPKARWKLVNKHAFDLVNENPFF